MRSIRIAHVVFLFLCSLSSVGQQRLKVPLVKYSQSDGLSSYNIKQTLKDKKGFLWIATQGGLTRFDGRSFVSYSKQAEDKHRISAPDIRALVEEPGADLLWVLPNRNGLNAINTVTGEVVRSIAIPAIDKEDWNTTMTECDGNLWIGSYSGLKIFNKRSGKCLVVPKLDFFLSHHASYPEVNCIAKDVFGNMWACYSGYGIIVYNGKTLQKLKEITLADLNDRLNPGMMRIKDYALLSDHEIVFGTCQGLRKISYDKNYAVTIDSHPCAAIPVLNSCKIEALAKTGGDEMMVSANNGLYSLNSAFDKYKVYEESVAPSESNWIRSVQSIYKDENILWFGCQQGVARIRSGDNAFSNFFYDEESGAKLEHLRSIAVLQNGDVLCGLGSGLTLISSADHKFIVKDKLHLYHHIFTGQANTTYLFRDDGMYIYENGTIKPITDRYREFEPFSKYPVNSHIILGDSAIALGTENDNGILVWNYKKHTVTNLNHSTSPALASNIVNNIYLDKNNCLWVLSGNAITMLSNRLTRAEVMTFATAATSKPADLFFDMCESGGSYWIASYGNGLLQLDKDRKFVQLITSKNGLSDEGVYNIFNVGDTNLIITTNNGLSVYDTRKQSFSNYYKEDGLHSDQFEEVAATVYNNKIYAGGINGFTIVDPSKFSVNRTPPSFYFTNIKVETRTGSINSSNVQMVKTEIPADWLQANVSFVGINYLNPKRVTYKYRIKERNENWTSLGTQNFVNLVGLNPGSYTLEVMALNEAGVASATRKLLLVFRPKWYETFWMEIIVAFGLAGLFYGFYLFRIKQFNKQQQIRREIASDLHDDIGSTLNSVKIYTHMAETSPNKQHYLDQIKESLKQASLGLRDMIWVLDDNQDSVEEWINRIKGFALPLVNASAVAINFYAEDINNAQFTKTQKRNFLLIVKEMINNSIKYSGCNKIDIRLQRVKGKIILSIEDDGCGFEENEIIPGDGLKNIQQRARQANYTATIHTEKGKGTRLVLSPLK